jgi:hypothetical protein
MSEGHREIKSGEFSFGRFLLLPLADRHPSASGCKTERQSPSMWPKKEKSEWF